MDTLNFRPYVGALERTVRESGILPAQDIGLPNTTFDPSNKQRYMLLSIDITQQNRLTVGTKYREQVLAMFSVRCIDTTKTGTAAITNIANQVKELFKTTSIKHNGATVVIYQSPRHVEVGSTANGYEIDVLVPCRWYVDLQLT